MQDWLAARAHATPNQIALIWRDHSYTYYQIEQLVQSTCAKYRSVGLSEGKYVAVLMPNGIDYVVTIHALSRLGCVLVPLNTRLTADEMHWQLQQVQAAMLLYTSDTAEQANELEPNRMQVDVCSLPFAEYRYSEVDLDAVQAIVFTSGTTGKPKGAEITFGNHFYSAMGSAYRLGHHTDDRWLSVLPLYHVGGLAVIFRCTLYGITTVLHERFDIEAIQQSFDAHQVTMISLVPTMLYRMLETGVRWPDSLRLVLLGGAAATPELLQRASDSGLPIAPTYGLTEASSQVATMLPHDLLAKPGSVGKPLLFSGVRIADDEGGAVAPGTVGEVVVSGPTLMRGYHQNADASEKTLRGGELYTGDMGYLDEDGDLWLVQRRSDLIVSGGENVYPAEVEAILLGHPAVGEVCVVGVDDPEWGQVVAAVVVPAAEQQLQPDDLVQYGREHLAGYKQPRRVLMIDALPQTASGKVQRRKVQELFKIT
jgi:O-succinylbenzoic acid--CoA ligase